MKLSTRARYGTRALLDLALHSDEGMVLLKNIAQRQGISVAYLEHLMTPLIASGIIRSTRGAKGGVSLLKHPKEIKLSEVIELLEGSISPVDCVNYPTVCPRSATCATRDIWDEMKKAIDKILENTTLQDLVDLQRKKEQAKAAAKGSEVINLDANINKK